MRIDRFLTILILSGTVILASSAAAEEEKEYRYTFDHERHRSLHLAGEPCRTCHLPDSPTITPDRRACLQCHDQEFASQVKMSGLQSTHGPLWGFNHGPAARNHQPECGGCHQQDYCLNCHVQGPAQEMGKFGGPLINVHRGDFRVGHPIAARTNPQLCATCHEPAFCNSCHSDFRSRADHLGRAASPSHRRVFGLGINGDIAAIHTNYRGNGALNRCDDCHRSGNVAPDMHAWGRDHAREARRSLNACQACHPDGDTCIQCHSAKSGPGGINPHGAGFSGSRAERLRQASGNATCIRCH